MNVAPWQAPAELIDCTVTASAGSNIDSGSAGSGTAIDEYLPFHCTLSLSGRPARMEMDEIPSGVASLRE